MSHRQRRRAEAKPPVAADPSSRSKINRLIHTGLTNGIIALGITGWLIQRTPGAPSLPSAAHRLTVEAPLHTQFQTEPQTLDELLDLGPELLAEVDIARINLLCATGLPGRISEADFRAELLLQVLQQDLGIKYDTAR
jgi:hypothetical protein